MPATREPSSSAGGALNRPALIGVRTLIHSDSLNSNNTACDAVSSSINLGSLELTPLTPLKGGVVSYSLASSRASSSKFTADAVPAACAVPNCFACNPEGIPQCSHGYSQTRIHSPSRLSSPGISQGVAGACSHGSKVSSASYRVTLSPTWDVRRSASGFSSPPASCGVVPGAVCNSSTALPWRQQPVTSAFSSQSVPAQGRPQSVRSFMSSSVGPHSPERPTRPLLAQAAQCRRALSLQRNGGLGQTLPHQELASTSKLDGWPHGSVDLCFPGTVPPDDTSVVSPTLEYQTEEIKTVGLPSGDMDLLLHKAGFSAAGPSPDDCTCPLFEHALRASGTSMSPSAGTAKLRLRATGSCAGVGVDPQHTDTKVVIANNKFVAYEAVQPSLEQQLEQQGLDLAAHESLGSPSAEQTLRGCGSRIKMFGSNLQEHRPQPHVLQLPAASRKALLQDHEPEPTATIIANNKLIQFTPSHPEPEQLLHESTPGSPTSLAPPTKAPRALGVTIANNMLVYHKDVASQLPAVVQGEAAQRQSLDHYDGSGVLPPGRRSDRELAKGCTSQANSSRGLGKLLSRSIKSTKSLDATSSKLVGSSLTLDNDIFGSQEASSGLTLDWKGMHHVPGSSKVGLLDSMTVQVDQKLGSGSRSGVLAALFNCWGAGAGTDDSFGTTRFDSLQQLG